MVPKIISRPDEARVIAAKQDIASVMQALKLYRLDNQRYPATEQGLQALVAQPTTAPLPPNWKAGGYVERLPKDPWGNPYQFFAASSLPAAEIGLKSCCGPWRDTWRYRPA